MNTWTIHHKWGLEQIFRIPLKLLLTNWLLPFGFDSRELQEFIDGKKYLAKCIFFCSGDESSEHKQYYFY